MKLIHFSSILVLFSSIAVTLSEDDLADSRKGNEIPDVVGTWRSERTLLSIHPDRRFELNGGPKGIQDSETLDGPVGTVKLMDDFSKRIASCLKDFETLKPGMSRSEISRLFPLDGGIHRISVVRFTHPDCPYFKVDVEFEFDRNPDDQNRPTRGDNDRSTKISKPYLEAPFLD